MEELNEVMEVVAEEVKENLDEALEGATEVAEEVAEEIAEAAEPEDILDEIAEAADGCDNQVIKLVYMAIGAGSVVCGYLLAKPIKKLIGKIREEIKSRKEAKEIKAAIKVIVQGETAEPEEQ